MAIKQRDGYACGYCGKVYTDPVKADGCRDSHELIYVPLSKTDLNRLLQFIYLTPSDEKTQKLLSPELMNTLTRYLRGN